MAPVPPRIPRTEHVADDASCHDDCSPYPAPVLPTPLPHPPPAPSSSSGSDGRSTFVTGLIIAGSVLAFLILCFFLFLLVRRRRQQRRLRREALLQAATNPNNDDGPDPDLEEAAEQGEVVHAAWHIRTVGLDEAAIESIALTRYRAGAAGASDCAVCLGEFTDGELLRLLPRCAHAFHVRCIDTWLRAHVNCPLCRAHVLDPTIPAATAAEPSGSPPGTDADTGQAANSNITTGHEQVDHQQASEQRELRLQIDQHQHDGRSTSPDQQPRRHAGGNFRRVASMDSPSPIASAEEAVPEADEQAGGVEKQGTGGAAHHELLSPCCAGRLKNHRGGGMKRSLSVGSRWRSSRRTAAGPARCCRCDGGTAGAAT